MNWQELLKRVPWKIVIGAALGAGLQAAGVPKGVVDTLLAVLAAFGG